MPDFLNPFNGLTPDRKLTTRELTRALRQMLSAEEEAVHFYEAIADATDQPLAKAVLQDIANEERTHAGEFQRLLDILLPDEVPLMDKGAKEVDVVAQALAAGGNVSAAKPDAATARTIGDLRM